MLVSKKKILFERTVNLYRKTVKWWKYCLKNPEARRILAQNKELKGKYAGKRCFVLGNGPSLKNVDFSLLKEEYVFTVNQIARRENFPELKSNFHFWADPVFFRIDPDKPEDRELLAVMKNVRTEDNDPIVFMPIGQRDFVKRFGLDADLNIRFYKSDLTMQASSVKIDYARTTPGFATVVQWCITMAIYMGFSEIYLLGCDNTGIITNINAFTQDTVTDYAYAVSENEQKRLQKAFAGNCLYKCASAYARTLLDYINLYEYTASIGVGLYNCTEKSAIDAIPHRDLNEVLHG